MAARVAGAHVDVGAPLWIARRAGIFIGDRQGTEIAQRHQGYSVHLRVLRVSVVNKVLEFFSILASRNSTRDGFDKSDSFPGAFLGSPPGATHRLFN